MECVFESRWNAFLNLAIDGTRFRISPLHVFTSSLDLFTGFLSVSFVIDRSDLLKLCFYYAPMKSALKLSNNGGF